MRLATWNVYEGAEHTYDLLIEFVKRHDIEILCLQEATGWQLKQPNGRSRLEDFAAKSGLQNFVYGNSNTACKLVTYTKHRVHRSKVHTARFWHCAVEAEIVVGGRSLKTVNTHLFPFGPDRRRAEALHLAEIATDKLIVADLNELSRIDNYPETLAQRFADQGNERHGIGEIEYGATDILAANGYVDLAAQFGQPAMTYPAKVVEEHVNEMRLDYGFAGPKFVGDVTNVEVVCDEITDEASDHRPEIFEIDESTLPIFTPQVTTPAQVYVPAYAAAA